MISGRQIRKARNLLGWDVATLGLRADLSDRLIERAENPNRKMDISLRQGHAIRQALERSGIEFSLNRSGVDVRLRKTGA